MGANYTWQSVMFAAALTAVVFLGLTVYAFRTKKDFTGAGPYLFGLLLSVAAWGLSLCVFAALGVEAPGAIMMYDLAATLVFVLYIIYDTQLILGGEHKACQFAVDDYVFAALNLYLDIIQLFLHLLRLLGKRK